jgi:hypothetical protein
MSECRLQGEVSSGEDFCMGYGEAALTAGVKFLEEKLLTMTPQVAIAAE